MNKVIQINNVSLKIKKTEILKDINIEFEKGKIHGFIGRNGSGKTMLMKCICGFIKPTDGEIIVNEKRIGKDCDFPDSVGIIRNTMQMVGLDPDLKRHVKKYSLGMRQRLGLAQAIMENPDLLILDEPMNGLDKEGVSDMRKYLLNLKEQGKTILIASHSAEDIEILCDTVCEMDKGVLTKLKGW